MVELIDSESGELPESAPVPAPAGFQFGLSTLFVVTTITAIVLIPAKILLADPIFRLTAGIYAVILILYFGIRGPFIYAWMRRLQIRRHSIDEKRKQILDAARKKQS